MRTLKNWESILFDRLLPTGVPALKHIAEAWKALALPLPIAPTVITVTGTNGKGSACRTLEQLALQQGKRVGVYSSPHLVSVLERIRLQGVPITEPYFCHTLEKIEPLAQRYNLSFFEWLTLAACLVFQESGLDLAILEVGIGGKWDAVNIIDADLALITLIDYDHLELLGSSRESIAREKSGIMRRGAKAVIAELRPPHSLQEAVDRLTVQAMWAGKEWGIGPSTADDWEWQYLKTRTRLPRPCLSLQSVGAALTAWTLLFGPPPADCLIALMPLLNLSGRCQQICPDPIIILDVAHNPQAFRYLFARLHQISEKNRLLGWEVICSMQKHKLIQQSLKAVSTPAQYWWHLPQLSCQRSATPEVLSQHLPPSRTQIYASLSEALDAARSNAPASRRGVVVCGGFLIIGEALKLFGQTDPKAGPEANKGSDPGCNIHGRLPPPMN